MGLITQEMDLTEQKPVDPDIANGTKYTAAKSATYEPVTREVDANRETVSGQLNKVLSEDSPVLQRARAGATQTANSRGLINSTMAAQAGEAAVIDAAMPIATGDANVYGTAARDNQTVRNAASATGADAANRAAIQNAGEANQLTKLKEQGSIETGLQTLKGEQDVALQTLRGTQATQLANIEANYRQLIQTSDTAGRLLTTSQQAISAVMADINTSTEQKQAAVNKISQMLEAGLSVIGPIANVDLASLLDFTTP